MPEDARVCLILGSKSDVESAKKATAVLEELGIDYEVKVSSAHRAPERTAEIAKGLEGRGIQLVICLAGYAAHLPGVVSAYTNIPVVAVPLEGSPLGGLDALYSQMMPGGVPVATMTVGSAGAKNSAIFAGRMLALHDEKIRKNLEKYVKSMRAKSLEGADDLDI